MQETDQRCFGRQRNSMFERVSIFMHFYNRTSRLLKFLTGTSRVMVAVRSSTTQHRKDDNQRHITARSTSQNPYPIMIFTFPSALRIDLNLTCIGNSTNLTVSSKKVQKPAEKRSFFQ